MELVSCRMKALLEDRNARLFQVVNRETVASLFQSEPLWPWYGQLMRTPQTIAWLLQLETWMRQYQVEIIA
jgi:asparagine synthase (glutamine-hydrolysing)